MNIKKIQKGKWYETKHGIGQALIVGGTHPPTVQLNIVQPFPRGRVYLIPRDILKEIEQPANRRDDQASEAEKEAEMRAYEHGNPEGF